jgi:general secretion pathway protein G
MVVIAIIGTLAAIAVPTYSAYVDKARRIRAIADIKVISTAIDAHKMEHNVYPVSLNVVGYGNQLDPWGRPYQYLNIETAKGKGHMRKDHFLVPINSDYDLYSMGPDGRSVAPLTARHSRDDIIRANNGGYVGLAEHY